MLYSIDSFILLHATLALKLRALSERAEGIYAMGVLVLAERFDSSIDF
jgi:hypothetical protein